MDRREFLKQGLTLASGALIAAGLGGFALDARSPEVQPLAASSSAFSSTSAEASTATSESLLADYQSFLAWLEPASAGLGKAPLNVSMESEFAPMALQLRANDFSRYSGIADLYNLEPYSLQLSAVTLMASTKSPSYDVFSVDSQNIGYFKDAVLPPTQLAEAYPGITYPELDLNDFSSFAWDNVALYPPGPSSGDPGTPSSALMLPLDMPLLVLYYRSDVYTSLGLSPPKTWDDYYDDVVSISKSGLAPYGVVNMASGTISVVYEFMVHLASFGGSLWDVDGETLTPNLDTDAALAALENYVRFKPYSDPGSSFYTWDDVFTDLARGTAATSLEWHDYYTWINDPSRSQESGKFSVTSNPSGPSGSYSAFGGSGAGVSAYSKNPEAAWLWLQWATAKGTQETLLLDQYHIYPTRGDVLDVPEVSDEVAASADDYAATDLAQQIWASSSVTALPGFPLWFKVLPILAGSLSSAWQGTATPSDALDTAQQGIEALGTLAF